MRILFRLIFLSTYFICSPIYATTYYVSPDGNNLNDGLSVESAWQTINKANGLLLAGDTVFIRGGIYYDQQINPVNNGSAGNPIVYHNYADETPVIREAREPLVLDDRSYVTIHGINIINCDSYGELGNTSHITIEYCRIDSMRAPHGFQAMKVGGPDASYNWIHHNKVGRCLSNSDDNENGDMISIEGKPGNPGDVHHNLVEYNEFYQSRHNVITVTGRFNVIRNNYIHSEEWDEDGQHGGRLAEITGRVETAGYNLIENNRWAFAGKGDARALTTGIKIVGPDNIFRRNLVYGCDDGPGMLIVTHPTDGPYGSDNNYVFHNVFFHNGNKNSLGHYGLWFRDRNVSTAVLKNNIFHDNPDAIGDPGENTIVSNWEEYGDPFFIDAEAANLDPANGDYPDFHLQGRSGCIDAGIFLTTTSGAGSGTILEVEDAHYFTDGWGIIEGDIIQLEGQTATAVVSNVDYENNVLTLETPLSWEEGTGVGFQYSGNAPDLGVYEYDGFAGSIRFELNKNTNGYGSIEVTPSFGSYDSSTVVILTAVPDEGYVFAGWDGDLTGKTNPDTLKMNSNKSITASFTEIEEEYENLAVTSVIASDEPEPENSAINTRDNDLNTLWAAEGDQWIQYDLGKLLLVSRIAMAVHKGKSRSIIFEIEVSQDSLRWDEVWSGLSINTLELENYNFDDVMARYVRLVTHGNTGSEEYQDWVSITEVEVWGKDFDEVSDLPAQSIEASDEPESENAAVNTRDNDLSTYWTAEGDQWIMYDLGELKTVSFIGIGIYKGSERSVIFEIELSEDGENWIEVWRGMSGGTTNAEEAFEFNEASARFVRLQTHGNNKGSNWASITELNIFGKNNVTDIGTVNELSPNFSLSSYPNPFNPSTTINYSLPKTSNIELAVYDITGSRVSELFKGNQTAGEYSFEWKARNNQGAELSSGVYFLTIHSEEYQKTIKLMYLR